MKGFEVLHVVVVVVIRAEGGRCTVRLQRGGFQEQVGSLQNNLSFSTAAFCNKKAHMLHDVMSSRSICANQ